MLSSPLQCDTPATGGSGYSVFASSKPCNGFFQLGGRIDRCCRPSSSNPVTNPFPYGFRNQTGESGFRNQMEGGGFRNQGGGGFRNPTDTIGVRK